MADVEWIKLYLKTFRTSRKLSAIERMKNGDTIIVIWFKLLCLAGEINDGGAIYVTPKIPFDEISLADELKKPVAVVKTAIKVFEEHDMVFKDDAGFIQIANWEKYQSVDRLTEIREQTRKRVAACRERQRKEQSNASCNVTSNATVTQGNAIEEEREEDEEGEKEFSFIHSCAREEEKIYSDPEYRRRYLGGIGKNVVFLSDEQMGDLLDKMSIEEFDYYVGVVADNELKGHHYKKKTHYEAILAMAMKDRRVKG